MTALRGERHVSPRPFRREPSGELGEDGQVGAGLASDLIVAAMELTASVWGELPPDGWLTWVDTRKVNSRHPGYCFKRAGWWLDRDYKHPYLLRFRAGLPDPWGKSAPDVGCGR